MDNALGYEPGDVGSIPAGDTNKYSMLNKLRTSLMGLFEQSTILTDEEVLEDIRHAMLKTAELHNISPALEHRITYAHDIETLWYLRTNLMAGISFCCGEKIATYALEDITSRFVGHIPGAK